jgi:hypothetical protein
MTISAAVEKGSWVIDSQGGRVCQVAGIIEPSHGFRPEAQFNNWKINEPQLGQSLPDGFRSYRGGYDLRIEGRGWVFGSTF